MFTLHFAGLSGQFLTECEVYFDVVHKMVFNRQNAILNSSFFLFSNILVLKVSINKGDL